MSSNRYKLLIVEDDRQRRSLLTAVTEAAGYAPLNASSCAEGLAMFSSHLPDLILLDLGLPDQDGRRLIHAVRQASACPIIVLSARLGENDKVEALDEGANDSVTKPFSTVELLARIRSELRAARRPAGGQQSAGKIQINGLTLDHDLRRVYVDGQEIRLTQIEFNILSLLVANSGRVLTYAAMIREVWGPTDVGGVKKLQVNMANIRRKLGERPGDNRFILNELGVGYRFVTDE